LNYIQVIPATKFKGRSTDLSKVDIRSVKNFTLDDPARGNVQFLEDVDLSGVESLDDHIEIGNNYITIDSEKLPELNKSAVVNLYNADIQNPVILVDGKVCTNCKILDSENGVSFLVEHFSTYVVSENSQLAIFDDSDSENVVPHQSFNIYGNYTNVSDGTPISGASCTVEFSDTGVQAMAYNGGSGMFEYSRSFSSPGVYYYFVDCDGSGQGYTELNGTDFASIKVLVGSGPRGASNVTEISSESYAGDSPADAAVFAGNLSVLSVFGRSTTQSWQGYFGNVSGTIELANFAGDVLYNWSLASPNGQIYATSAFDFNFPTLQCANSSHIEGEEQRINQNSSDVDSVSNTFGVKNHPLFYVGNQQFSSDDCFSINLFDETGEPGSEFYEVLLGDGGLNILYTALLEEDSAGFDDKSRDFEMIVGVDGHEATTDIDEYFFYLELR
jgi:hypothetical protein